MAKALAYISGTALAPGVSRNNRLYTREAIGKAVRRAQDRLAEGKRPIGMYTYHETTNTRELVGGVTRIWQEDDGSAKYVAAIADTGTGRDIANLVDPSGDEPAFLRGVSIKGNWVGPPRQERAPGGGFYETGSDMEIGRLDWTSEPGVSGAGVDTFRYAASAGGESGEQYSISESAPEALVETAITEETAPAAPLAEAAAGQVRDAARAVLPPPPHVLENGLCVTCQVTEAKDPKKPYGDVQYADPGYQKDGQKRYPLDTEGHIRSAWSYISQAKNAAQYSSAQIKRIKGRIKAAMTRIGAKIAAEGWVLEPARQVTEAVAEAMGDPAGAGSYSLTATNGPTTVTVCSYGLDPADLAVILQAACCAASAALCTLDPDMDGDIDLPGAGAEDTDGDSNQMDGDDATAALARRLASAIRGESAEPLEDVIAEARAAAPGDAEVTETSPADPATTLAAADQETEAPVTETTTTQEAAGTVTAAPSLSRADVDAAVAAALDADRKARKAARKAKAAKAAESASPAKGEVTETAAEPDIAALVAEGIKAALAEQGLTESTEQKVARLVAEGVTRAKQELAQAGGGPGRKGLVTEHSAARADDGTPANFPLKDGKLIPSEQWSEDQRRAAGAALQDYVLGSRAVY